MYDRSANISRILVVRSTRKFRPTLISIDKRVMVSRLSSPIVEMIHEAYRRFGTEQLSNEDELNVR